MKPYMSYQDPGDIIRARRMELGMRQTELANLLDIKSGNFITVVEQKKSQVPAERAVELSRILDMDPVWFVEKVLRQKLPDIANLIFDKHDLVPKNK